jgi:hypothetical protein
MVGEYVLFSAHNSNFTHEFAIFFYPSYFMAQEVSVAPKVFATKQVIQIDGFAFGSSPITKDKRVPAVMP